MPGDEGLSRGIACRRAAWKVGWLLCPESPGCHPGLFGPHASTAHKKPPAGAGGLRVACRPGCHAMPIRTGKSCPVVRHGRWGGFHARSPRVATRGFLGPTRQRHTKSPRREPGDSGWHAFSGAMRCGVEPGNHVPSCGMEGGVAFVPGVPGLPPGASGAPRANGTQNAPGGSRGIPGCMPSRVPCDVGGGGNG